MNVRFLSLFFAMMIFAGGCADNPGSIGLKQIPPGGQYTLIDTTLTAVYDTTYISQNRPNGTGVNILVGRSQGAEAKALMQFSLTGVPDSLRRVKIDTAEIIFHVDYTWNIGATPPTFVIRRVMSVWDASTFLPDSFPALQIDPATVGTINDTLVSGTDITIQLDTTLARAWVTAALDSTPDHGIEIEAASGGETGVWGFSSFNSIYPAGPILQVKYGPDSLRTTLQFVAGSGTFVVSGSPAAGRLETQGGLPIRTKLRFDLTGIPTTAVVNNARMEIVLDNAGSSVGIGVPDTVYAFPAVDAVSVADSVDATYFAYGYRTDATQSANSVYGFSNPYMINILQRWVSKTVPNRGIVLVPYSENASMNRLLFYQRTEADSTKRPRLHLTFTRR